MGENGQYKVNLPGSPSQCSSSALGNSEKIPLTHVSSSRSSFSRYSICSSVQLKKPPPEKHLSPQKQLSLTVSALLFLPPLLTKPAHSCPLLFHGLQNPTLKKRPLKKSLHVSLYHWSSYQKTIIKPNIFII